MPHLLFVILVHHIHQFSVSIYDLLTRGCYVDCHISDLQILMTTSRVKRDYSGGWK